MKRFLIFVIIICISEIGFSQNINSAKKYFEDKKYKEAKRELEMVLKSDAKNQTAHFILGQTLFFLKLYEEASSEFKEAISLNEKKADYHYWLAQSYGAEALNSNIFSQFTLVGKIKDEYLRALEIDNKHLLARAGLANFYLRAPGIMGGSIEKAYEHANILTKYDEKWGRYLLAQIYTKDDKKVRAEEEYKLLEKKYGNLKDFYDFYNLYGYFLLDLGRKEEAIEKFKKQIELAPLNANSYDSYGDALVASGRKNEAAEQYKKALEIDPTFEPSKKKMERLLNNKSKD